ncbi:hypothetical protein VCR3J2_150013 [Vibrio coralliirubri]|nr:hypothetical protein VCR3J2_150013 [Vibrio coralliirubri]
MNAEILPASAPCLVSPLYPPSYIRQILIDLLDYGTDTELLSLSNV